MSSRPTIIWPASPSAPRLYRDDGAWKTWGPAVQISGPCDVVLPGQMVRIYAHELPKMRERDKLSAARFSIEDRTGAPLDSQHVVLAAGGDQRIAVIDEAALRGVIETLAADSIDAAEIYADFDWLAADSGTLRLADRIIFTGPQGYTIDPDWADDELAKLPLSRWPSAPNAQPNDGALSLRQGVFARRKGFGFSAAGFGRIAALLAASGLAWLGLTWAQARAANQQATSLRADTSQLYQKATGQAAPSNPALAVTRAVKSAPQSSQSFLVLMTRFNSALANTNDISIESVSYAQGKPQLVLRLIYPSFDAASEIERAVLGAGGTLNLGGVREQNGVLIGDAIFEIGEQ